jgi:hypothetical protein
VQIADIEVRLFYHGSGTFSRDITMTDRPEFTLWNTLIGKGDAQEPSSAVLATVVLLGPAGATMEGVSLRFEVRDRDGSSHYAGSSKRITADARRRMTIVELPPWRASSWPSPQVGADPLYRQGNRWR